MSGPWDDGLCALADRIARRELSAVEATGQALAEIGRWQPHINAVIRLEADAALAAARALDARLAKGEAAGPLAGVPLAHKDMYYRKGKPTTCGARIRDNSLDETTATVLTRLEAAGALYLGGLNMSEFAVGPSGHNRHHGHCRNPWNPAHSPGGSSGGSGAAVAAGMVPAAFGSDTAGSIRLPSAFNGVVGLKPTQYRVSRAGMMPLSFSFDNAGPLARRVKDAARLYMAVAGADPADPLASDRPVEDAEAACGQPVKGMRLARPRNYYYEDLDPPVAAAMEAAAAAFTALGCEIVEVEVPDHDVINDLWNAVFAPEAAAFHRKWLESRPEDYQEQVRRRIETGLWVPATRYIDGLSLRGKVLAAFGEAVFARADAMLVPTVGLTAPTLDSLDVGASDEMPKMILRMSRLTRPISYLGLPSLAVPCGFAPDGLPMGLQLVGRPFHEATLFRLGHAYEQATDWHRRRPVPPAA